MMTVQFQTVCTHSPAVLDAHRAYSRGLGLTSPLPIAGKLAIVGGGASTIRHIEELKAWNGDVWGINGAAKWCHRHMIDATLVSASPSEWPSDYAAGVTKAILAETCNPKTFDALAGADLSIFDHDDNGPTSTMAALFLAVEMGCYEIHFFGCEGNYGASTHAYQDIPIASDIIVRAGGTEYRTNVGYFIQSQLLAHAISRAPMLVDRSGGLLAALVADPEGWDVVKIPSEMKDAA